MSELKAEIWVQALLRRAQSGGAMGMVVARGDRDAGAVWVKVMRLDGSCETFVPARNFEGERIWTRPNGIVPEAQADAHIRRAMDRDPDLWVVEIEDRHGRHFLTEPVEEG
ncbi:MAG: hypothetical protein CMF74_08405 [Maricaulis sp.]|jgi:hypothetical protein|nr:hypothetical protein [Maricaulis sp.]HAQ35931.1 DUF1491 domain-containing protein [Alphaproteobacteria bacterium]|tara:strand:- start:24 stop:356 length:333 start_codon:yes stop_codon:yes gene_type:complete